MNNPEHSFSDLPAALLEEVIEKTATIGEELISEFSAMQASRTAIRDALLDKGLIRSGHSLPSQPAPTTCAADGTYAVERLLSVDFVAAAAVVVEGLTPPSEKRHWEEPHHMTYIRSEVHHADTATILRSVMIGNELLLAHNAPHDLVMLDGSYTLPVIYFNQGVSKAGSAPLKTAEELRNKLGDYLSAYIKILLAERSDRQFVALPKYSTRRELGLRLGWPDSYDDRWLLTHVLQPGEFTRPLPLAEDAPWHIGLDGLPSNLQVIYKPLIEKATSALRQIYVFYYKPDEWLPALRVEAPVAIATNDHRLSVVIQGLQNQSVGGSMLEPYPIYLADRMVKALARAMPTFRQVAAQQLAENYGGDIGEVFRAMHGYRSESGG